MKPIAIVSSLAVVLFSISAGAQPAASPPPEAKAVTVGPTRELKLAENTWIRFGFQVQTWFKAAQDRIIQADGSEGGFAFDFYCRRCRIFASGSVVKDVTFILLLEEGNFGKADPVTGTKAFVPPALLDAHAQVKFADAFYLSAGSILLPLTRNGLQPTTTYTGIDIGNTSATAIANTTVLRDLGVQANGFFVDDHLEYRVGMFQGARSPAGPFQLASHNAPRFVGSLSANFWDTEKGYVNGGHYYGTKKILGVMANVDYQKLHAVNAYFGASAAVFLNYPLSGAGSKTGGDEIVGLLQGGYYDGGAALDGSNAGSYPTILKQYDVLTEAAYFNQALKLSFFGKFEMRKIDNGYSDLLKQANNIMWIAGGLKYYVAPSNMLNFGIQYERTQFTDAPTSSAVQKGIHSVTAQMQLVLY